MTKIMSARPKASEAFYQSFDNIDGSHPWMQAAPNGYVAYRVRNLFAGKVTYFNFSLAKEMGLISSDHPNSLNPILEQKLLDTFSLQIINEYDEVSKRKIDPTSIRPNKYMATRYLQLQHSNKQGKTSGDGRGIWNGTVRFRGTTWDISSRGTGVTCLAPGAVQANKPLKTGGEEFGYGCGLAEIDELYGCAILSEIMHLQGLGTERVLCIIDLGKGHGIGIRAAPNLLRPAHLFPFLKQERYEELKKATDYLIARQIQNKEWNFNPNSASRYAEMAKTITKSFAEFAATLEVEYIFAWLDWDGDNVLSNAGIIDYGSVRQFGLRHDQYRYDDVERFSTNLNEQKTKAKQICQVFAQLADYLTHKKKKPLKDFARHEFVQQFDKIFARKKADRLLYKMGLSEQQRGLILKNHYSLFEEFYKVFSYFERAKVSGPVQKVADGVNRPALFNMRRILKQLPTNLMQNISDLPIAELDFFHVIRSNHAIQLNIQLGEKHLHKIRRFQGLYKELITAACPQQRLGSSLKSIGQRAHKLNSDDRITGNALIQIVDEMIQETKRGLSREELQKIIDRLVLQHVGMPEVKASSHHQKQKPPQVPRAIYARLMSLVEEYQEDI